MSYRHRAVLVIGMNASGARLRVMGVQEYLFVLQRDIYSQYVKSKNQSNGLYFSKIIIMLLCAKSLNSD
ncbi:unnamed protein product [Acanthoscelides obtectus]|uniref:Uncharacterized protein n=1 Tax=Acanthoscelides obtectus TaxID=200917 RepID=A0A9P0KTT2_ACAOB|nr:unnamed protein product [Acanthoscelides obtectus]CAH1991600.1 unnamed protein product [Acanthoscelides obtectus]CAK1639266.1 hypothetical protein AOBTE_LOCUS11080 [Acanthoscelides obtectus]CAK1639277.1 hypothetical protein AOBTE_LOCUS11091 [Acanthoscelides obtectus]